MEKHSQVCKYELSRWIVEPLTKELEKCNSQIHDMKIKYITLEQACSNQRAICEDLSRQMQELTQIQNDYIRVSPAVKPSFNTSDTPRKTSSDFSGFSLGAEKPIHLNKHATITKQYVMISLAKWKNPPKNKKTIQTVPL
jgi:hypothetical protein